MVQLSYEWLRVRAPRWRRRGLHLANRIRYRALADPNRILSVELKDIQHVIFDYELLRCYRAGVVLSSFGDQPLVSREMATRDRYKPRAIREHFLEGVPWQQTELFTKVYAGRLRNGETVRASRSMEELIQDYEQNIDPLFESLKTEGVRPPGPEDPHIDPIFLHIGPSGEFIAGNNGNHRLYMADILSIQTMPVMIFSRHKAWQEVRECARKGIGRMDARGLGRHASHPDLEDILPEWRSDSTWP